MMDRRLRYVALTLALLLGGCQVNSKDQVLAAGTSQVQLRSFQSRAFDTTNQEKTLRTVIATLQDLSFVIIRRRRCGRSSRHCRICRS